MKKIVFAFFVLLFSSPAQGMAQRLRRSISPEIIERLAKMRNITPEELQSLKPFLERTNWKVLEMDDDPSDNSMQIVAAQNMEYRLGDFQSIGSPHNGLIVHLQEVAGFQVNDLFIVFNDSNEAKLFGKYLAHSGFKDTTGYGNSFRKIVPLPTGVNVVMDVELDVEAYQPQAHITIYDE